MLAGETILALLQAADTAESACRALVDAANAAGGKDNVTALVIVVEKID